MTEPQAADTVSKIKRGLEALSMASAPQQGQNGSYRRKRRARKDHATHSMYKSHVGMVQRI